MFATVMALTVASLSFGSPASPQSVPTVTIATQAQTDRAASRDTLRLGSREIPAGDTVAGPVLVAGGDLRVHGTIRGTAIAILGDIILEEGGLVTGDAIAILGGVQGGPDRVGGQAKSYAASFHLLPDSREVPARADGSNALGLAFAWLIIMLLIGMGVVVFATQYLGGVTDVLERSFWRSFLVGVAAELGLIPVMVLLIAGLAVTVVGILLIPFAVVAYVLAVMGLLTLGFLSVAQLVGESVGRGSPEPRGRALRGVIVGVTILMGTWVIAALLLPWQFGSAVLRMLAFALTYVSVTTGLGAAVLSRGGTRRDVLTREPDTDESQAWQTPTPVTGVTAARRPVKTG